MLTVTMLGKVGLCYRGEDLCDKLSHKMVAMICLLVLQKGRDVSKERLASYFWPDSDDEAARYNVRYSIWMIRKLIPRDANGEELLQTGKDSCRINEQYQFTCDKLALERFRTGQSIPLRELEELHRLFRGDFMEGLYLKNCNEFNELVLFERVVCQTRQIEILNELAKRYQQQERFAEGLAILQEMTLIEPYNESFAESTMQLLASAGNRPAAIQFYKKFEKLLRSDLNIQPNSGLQSLYAVLVASPCGERPRALPETDGNRSKLSFEASGLKNVPYYLLADIIRGILEAADQSLVFSLDARYLLDLGFIQNDLLLSYEAYRQETLNVPGSVPDVRIVQAFCKLLEHLSLSYDLEITVRNPEEIDELSRGILQHMQQDGPENLHFYFGPKSAIL